MSGTTTYQMRFTLESIHYHPALADTFWGARFRMLTPDSIPLMQDPVIPVDEVWFVSKTETGGVGDVGL